MSLFLKRSKEEEVPETQDNGEAETITPQTTETPQEPEEPKEYKKKLPIKLWQ